MKEKIYSFASSSLDNYFVYREKLPSNLDLFESPVDLYHSVDDKWTVFFPYELARQYRNSNTSTRVGLGIRIDSTGSGVLILHVTPNSPAAIAGLQKGDTIISVNSFSVINSPLDDIINLLRGFEGTTVSLTVKRVDQNVTIPVTRASYESETVFSEFIDSSTAYIQLTSFKNQTIIDGGSQEEFRQALEKYNYVQNIILDLRGNGGGWLPQCMSIAGYFLPPKTRMINVDIRDSSNGTFSTIKSWYSSSGDGAFGSLKLYVLCDKNSASASELLIAGLQANKNDVTLIGDTTYGKACGQRVIDEGPDSTIAKVTAMKIYRTDGTTYHEIGIAPDIVVPSSEAKTKAIQIISGKLHKQIIRNCHWSEVCLDSDISEPMGLLE